MIIKNSKYDRKIKIIFDYPAHTASCYLGDPIMKYYLDYYYYYDYYYHFLDRTSVSKSLIKNKNNSTLVSAILWLVRVLRSQEYVIVTNIRSKRNLQSLVPEKPFMLPKKSQTEQRPPKLGEFNPKA